MKAIIIGDDKIAANELIERLKALENVEMVETKKYSKLLVYTNMCDFKLVDKNNVGLFQYNHELRSWEVVVAGNKQPIRLKRNLKSEALMELGDEFIQVNQKYIININFLIEVIDNVCRFYPPFEHVDYVKLSRVYRRKFVDRFLIL